MRDAYIVDGVRTPIGRYAGALSSVRTDDLAAHILRALLDRHSNLDTNALSEVALGCANQAGEDNRNVARMASLIAGVPETVPGLTINRLCASGLDAVIHGARALRCGEADLVLAGGVESMSRAPFVLSKAPQPFSREVSIADTTIGWRFVNAKIEEQYGVESMGETAENVAEAHAITRVDQDAFALRSQMRVAKTLAAGLYGDEIAPTPVPQRRGDPILVDRDEHPRADATAESLAHLKPAFRRGGTVTAGNASGVNDGAAALLLASEPSAARHSLEPRTRIVAAATAGVAPRVMGLGPIPATDIALQRADLNMDQIDVIELNEAFAAQVLACTRAWGLADDDPRVNADGGAIALGHPLGMTGARLVIAATRRLHAENGRYGLATLCVGVGQGVAVILERV